MSADPVFDALAAGQSVRAVAEKLKLPKSTVGERAKKLLSLGAVARAGARGYKPGPNATAYAEAVSGLSGKVPVGWNAPASERALRVHARQWKFPVRWAPAAGRVPWSAFPGRKRASGEPSQFALREDGVRFTFIPARPGGLGTLIVQLPERVVAEPEGEEDRCREDAKRAVLVFAERYGFRLADTRGERVGRLQYGMPAPGQPPFGNPNVDGVFADGSLKALDPGAPTEFEMVPGRAASPDVPEVVTVAHVSSFMRGPVVERTLESLKAEVRAEARDVWESLGQIVATQRAFVPAGRRGLPPEHDPGVA